jgi:hypothetical protein
VSNNILIVREGDRYLLLHGHLRLINTLALSDAAAVNVKGEGDVTIVRTGNGYFVDQREGLIPLFLRL